MQTTLEIPDELLIAAQFKAAQAGISLRELFIEALERRVSPRGLRARRYLPLLCGTDGHVIGVMSSEKIDEALFG